MVKLTPKLKFIAFIDILGFASKVRAAERLEDGSLEKLVAAARALGPSTADKAEHRKYGPTTCPAASFLQKDLDFQVTQVSDCAIISAEISPAGVINLISHCWTACFHLLKDGFLCRGYITRGLIVHDADHVIGSGYLNALEGEKSVSAFKRNAEERGTPFIEVDTEVVSYVQTAGDACVKEMFSRMTKSDGQFTALFPFKRLNHSFVITGGRGSDAFNPEKELKSLNVVRGWIRDMKGKVLAGADQGNPQAITKTQHYVNALDAQLVECDRTEQMINMLTGSFPQAKGTPTVRD